ncbi:MAG: cell division protein FtsA [Elusimicrobia bacterium]|nr:cell division protein FtsA [Elusimicrobiota bacterium]
MASKGIFTALDLGSSRVVCVIAAEDPKTGGVEVLGHSMVACRGLRGGVVVNIVETAQAVARAVEAAEEQAEETVQEVHLGVRGAHFQTFNNRGACNIARTDKEITAEDVTTVIENAKAIPISNDREILHVIPQGFSLDRQRGVPNPAGMEGSLLEVEVHVVTASSTHLNNLFKAVNQAGFEVAESIYSLLAVGDLVVTDEEKELGSVLVDLGGQTVGVAVYAEGSIRFSRELALGSDLITRDLAYGLRTSLVAAQNIKERHGAALSSLLNGEEDVEFLGVDGRSPRKIKQRTLVEIIQPRVEEIFTVVMEELQSSGLADVVVPGGAILTGGGSLLRGMPEAAEQILGMPVRMGLAQIPIVGTQDISTHPSYVTALGLLRYPEKLTSLAASAKKKSGWRRRVTAFFEDIF